MAVLKKVRKQITSPTQEVLEAIIKDGNETRDAIAKLQKDMTKQKTLLMKEIIRKPMTTTQAKELVCESLGFPHILDRFDIKISRVANKPIYHICSDFESSSLALGFDTQILETGKLNSHPYSKAFASAISIAGGRWRHLALLTS